MLRKLLLLLGTAALVYSAGSGATEAQRGPQGSVQLPEGNGKQLVESTCQRCHALGVVLNAGYKREDWLAVFGSMVKLPNDQAATIADYLAKNFPEKPKPPAVVIPGAVNVSIKEWEVPTPGSRPHDPLATSD